MQLLASLTQQNAAGASSVVSRVEPRNPAQHLVTSVHPRTNTKAPTTTVDDVLTVDDREGVSLLDTPAPRRRPPVPTEYEPDTAATAYQPNGSSRPPKLSSVPGFCGLIMPFCFWQMCAEFQNDSRFLEKKRN